MPTLDTLKAFLRLNISKDAFERLVDNVEDEAATFVQDNYDVFNEEILRKLVTVALKARDDNILPDGSQKVADSQLLGVWGVIIDAVRETTSIRQDRAGDTFKQVVATAQREGPRATATIISRFYRAGAIDTLFQELLAEAVASCRSSNTPSEALEMFEFVQKVIDQNKAVEKARASQLAAGSAPPAAATPSPVQVRAKASEEGEVHTATHDQQRDSLTTASGGSDARMHTTVKPVVGVAAGEEEARQERLIAASHYLKRVIDESRGDAAALQKRIQTDLWREDMSFDIDDFAKVVGDTVDASQQAGYVNRVKLLQFIESRVLAPLRTKMLEREKQDAEETGIVNAENVESSNTNGYHAPQFLDDNMRSYHKKILTPDVFLAGFAKEPAQVNKISKTGQLIKSVVQENAQEAARKFLELAASTGKHMEAHGWAVIDNFVPADLVRRVRIEAGLFQDHYEQSEIWVGKQADVGTLLSVPSIRGDKVIWMCGGHDQRVAPEGISRVVRTKGDIEPCRLEAKARAPMRKFAALKEIVKSIDALVDEMKPKVKAMQGIYERSDAMLANYPGGGSRFARHIDNTTLDGRRLTILIYLNPGWEKTQGGALRLTPPSAEEGIDVYPDCGRLAMFYSADMPHEVLPTWGDRHAITVWYYDTEERIAALDSAKNSGAAEAANRACSDAQREAKQFIADLMGGDEIDTDGGEPTQEELTALANKVKDLSDVTLGIVANITSAPSVDSFREGFGMLTPGDLKHMRQLFRRMGLAEEK